MNRAHSFVTDQPLNPARAIWASVLKYAPTYLEMSRAYALQPGFQCAIGIDGEIMGAISGGYAHLKSETTLTNEHLFRIASHSKTFTATAIMILREDGLLSLEDRVGSLVDELQNSDIANARVSELLSHSAGISRDSEDSDFWVLDKPFPSKTELLEICQNAKIIERNEHFKYTNIGYGILGLIIEAVSKKSYAEFVAERILEPLELSNTGSDIETNPLNLAAGYGARIHAGDNFSLTARTEIKHINTGALAAATGFYSTASDVVRYFSSHFLGSNPSVLTDESKRLMQRQVEETGATGNSYGLGLILQKIQDRETFGHSGGYPGHITRTWAVPETGVVLSMLTNAIDGQAASWGEQLFALAALAEQQVPDSYAGVDEKSLERFTGRFATLWGMLDVVLLGGKIFLINPTGTVDAKSTVPLEFVDESTLKSMDPNGFGGYAELAKFDFDEAGACAFRGPGGALYVRQREFNIPPVLELSTGESPTE